LLENWPTCPDRHSSPPLHLVVRRWPYDGGLPTRFRTEPNLVFCMDTFTRVRKKWILNYFKEFERILVKGGAVVVHVPNDDLPVSRGRGFTSLDSCEIAKLCTKHFTEFVIDSMTLKHGSVIYAKK